MRDNRRFNAKQGRVMSKSEQNGARYVLQELLEVPKTMLEISKATGIPRFDLESFYRAKAGSDLTPKEISKLEKLQTTAVTE